MTFTLDNSVVYDIETFPNVFTLAMECLNSDHRAVWEISHRRDDRAYLMEWFQWLAQTQTPMIGYNNVHFDYPVIHWLFNNPQTTVEQIYDFAMNVIFGDRFANTIWPRERFAPQVDLYKMNHFDNKAKATSLKWLQVNMRSDSVVDMPVENGSMLTPEQTEQLLIPYNISDVTKTKHFAQFCKTALDFRVEQVPTFGVDVMNWNDTKIGEETIIKRLGQDLCYDRSSGRRKKRQTPRGRIALNDIIFPYVQFQHPEFNRVLDYLRSQVLTASEVKTFGQQDIPQIKTKGVFTDLHASVGGIDFHFGVGGIHGSVERQKFIATDEWLIKDIDVASLYPSIAIANNLAPAHLGATFTQVYSEIPKERKRWQQEKGKKCVEANALKLAANGAYGKSNSAFSVLYDPQFTMTITVNGQLLLCMLAERLAEIPTLKLIQANTDGITYMIHKDYLHHTVEIEKQWEQLTGLVLEEVFYQSMFIRDVNSYLSVDTEGGVKLKGAYWTPDPGQEWHDSIATAQPPAWHKNLSNPISTRAAVAYFTHGVDPMDYIRSCTDPHEFTCAVKAKGKDKLVFKDGVGFKYFAHGKEITKDEYDQILQSYSEGYGTAPDYLSKVINEYTNTQGTCRYYVSHLGKDLIKVSPAKGPEGQFKKANGVDQEEYERVMREVNYAWDARVCTKNKSTYETGYTGICAGFKVKVCNDIGEFDFNDVNYEWYVEEAKKLIF